jgi:hypothetical protein
MKTIIALLKWLFGPEPESPPPPAKKPYGCGWQRARNLDLRFRNIERVTVLTPTEMRAEDQQLGLPWFPEDIQ